MSLENCVTQMSLDWMAASKGAVLIAEDVVPVGPLRGTAAVGNAAYANWNFRLICSRGW